MNLNINITYERDSDKYLLVIHDRMTGYYETFRADTLADVHRIVDHMCLSKKSPAHKRVCPLCKLTN